MKNARYTFHAALCLYAGSEAALELGYVNVEFPPAGAGVEVLESGSRTERTGRVGMTRAWVRAAKAARRSVVAMVSLCGFV